MNGTFRSRMAWFSLVWIAHLTKFFSKGPERSAAGFNAFARNLNGLSGYAFLPFALIFKFLEKIVREKADIFLVCPV